jgi:ABC-type multidrug transport system ATPase subunit
MPVFVESVVYEKEHKLTDMMRMMGLTPSVYWLVQYLFNWILYLIVVVVLCSFGSILGLRFFLFNSPGLYILLFLLWGFTLIGMSLFASTLFRTTRSATISLYFFIIIMGIAADVTSSLMVSDPGTSDTAYGMASLVPTFALNRALYYLSIRSAGRNDGIQFENGNKNGNQIFSLYGFLIGEAVFFHLLFALIEFWPQISAMLGIGVYSCNRKLEEDAANQKHGHAQQPIVEPPEVAAERARVERIMEASDKSAAAQDFHGVVIRNLHKRFVSKERDVTAVKDLSFVIPEDCLTAVLGHNGAGKTTTINMLCGMFAPTSGDVYMGGYNLRTEMEHVYPMMGVCPQFDLLWESQTGREHLLFYGRIKGLKGKALADAVSASLQSVNLTEFQNVLVSGYSGGMKRRLSVAMALIGDPKIVFLDEPSTGLDPHSRRELWDAIQKVKPGRAMILTTHSMEEADALSDRIAVMNHGRLVAIGHSEELKARYGHGYRLSVSVSNPSVNDARLKEYVTRTFAGSQLQDTMNGLSHFSIPFASVRMSEVFERFESVKASLGINEFGISRTTLEEVFETLTTLDDEREKKHAAMSQRFAVEP